MVPICVGIASAFFILQKVLFEEPYKKKASKRKDATKLFIHQSTTGALKISSSPELEL